MFTIHSIWTVLFCSDVVRRYSNEAFNGWSFFHPCIPRSGWCRISLHRWTGICHRILGLNGIESSGGFQWILQVSDSFKKSLTAAAETKMSPYDYYGGAMMLDESSASNNCSGSSFIDTETVDIEFQALQYSLFITTIIAALSAYFFFANAW